MTDWFGFIGSLVVILAIAGRNLPLALIAGAVVIGFVTLPVDTVLERFAYTLTDPSILMLAVAMGIIPVIGGTMRASGQVDLLVGNLRVKRRWLLPLSASMMGLLPMPGGALLSAPIVEKGGEGVPDELKAAINNWFRHLFILIYPLSPALVASAKIAGLDLYVAMVHLLPGTFLAIILGYFFYLRQVRGAVHYDHGFSWRGLVVPLGIILSAPVLDFTLKRAFGLGNLATVIGVLVALGLSIALATRSMDLRPIIRRMKPWNFALIIIGMFLYLHVFEVSPSRLLIAELPLPPLMLAVVAGFGLGFATGRVQLPASIIFPVYLAAVAAVTPTVFALIYIAIFFGYIISPVHPCLVVTSEYFHVPIRGIMRRHAVPTAAVFGIVLVIVSMLLIQ